MEERFEERFPLEYFTTTEFLYSYKETLSEWQFLDYINRETNRVRSRKEEIKSFIRSEIELAKKEERERIVEMIEEVTGDMRTSETDKIINLITNNK